MPTIQPGHVVGAVYNVTPPSAADGQAVSLQCDVNGILKVTSAGGGGSTVTQGPPGLVSAPWFVELSNGTNPVGTAGVPLRIDPTGTTVQPVSGTVAVSNFPASQVVVGNLTTNNAAPGATNIGALVAVASAAAPTYTTGDQVLLSTDLSGALRVSVGAVVASNNITEWNTVALGSPTAFGVSPSGNVIGVNAELFAGSTPLTSTLTGSPPIQALNVFVTNATSSVISGTVSVSNFPALTAVTQSTSPWVVSGTVAVTQSTSPWVVSNSGTFAVQIPTSTKVIVWDGTNQNTYKPASTASVATDTSLVVQVSPNQPTALFTGTVPGTAPGNTILVGQIYNSSPPAPTTGQTLPLQSDSAGNLKVSGAVTVSSGTITTVTAVTAITNALPTGANTIGKVDILGNGGAILDAVTTAATAPANGLATLVKFLPQASQPALSNGQSVMLQGDQTGATYVNTEGRKATFSASANFTGAAGVIAVLPGSASATIRVLRVEVSIYTTGTSAIEVISLIRTSSAPTGGTSAAMTIAQHDTGDAAASAVPLDYTVAPTVGTSLGAIRSVAFADSSAAALPGSNSWLWEFGIRPGQAIVLRGTAQTLEINLGGAVATQTCIVSFEWTEE